MAGNLDSAHRSESPKPDCDDRLAWERFGLPLFGALGEPGFGGGNAMVREAYESPQVIEIGVVTELTQGTANEVSCLDAPDPLQCFRSQCARLGNPAPC